MTQFYFDTGCDLQHYWSQEVMYLDEVVRGVLLQVCVQERLHCLQQAVEAEAHKQRVVGFLLCHYSRQLNPHILLRSASC